MDRDRLQELFAPFAAVGVRRMFGGSAVYADSLCFALDIDGEVYLKADAESQAAFAAAAPQPFVYAARGREVSLGYWRLPAAAYDDEDELKRWANLALAAAARAAAAKRVKATAKRADRPGGSGRRLASRAAPRPRG